MTALEPLPLRPPVVSEPLLRPPEVPRMRGGTASRPRRASRVSTAISRSWGFARLVGLLDRLDRRSDQLLVSLMYHRVEDHERSPDLDPGLISATPADFERQMAYLAARRPLLSLGDALAIRRGEQRMPRGAVMVTFDDGYRDFADHAWPVLKRYGVPVTLFVPTAYPGRPERTFWWDRVHAALSMTTRREPLMTPAGLLGLSTPQQRREARRAIRDWVWATPHDRAMAGVAELVATLDVPPSTGRVLDWDELRALSDEGVALAPQTLTHPMLNRLPLEHAQEEILGSVEDLRREVGTAPPAFAYPAGGHSDELVEWLGTAGFELAFTTERGGNDLLQPDWLRLRRINIGCRSSVALMRAQMLSWTARPGGRAQRLLARV